MKPAHGSLLLPVFLALSALACGLPQTAVPTAAPASTPPIPTEVVPAVSPTSGSTSVAVAVVARPGQVDLVHLDGSLASSWAAPGLNGISPGKAQVVGSSIYYVADSGVVREVSAQGVTDFAFTAMPGLSAFAVSPDESMLAWSTSTFGDKVQSQLWLAARDGSGKQMVTGSDPADEIPDWFVVQPVQFAPDGRLVYSWQITGIGGYILFFGYSSLYAFDPSTSATAPLVPLLSDSTGPCWSTVRADLAYAVGMCPGSDGALALRERDLATGQDRLLPDLPDQGQAGAAAYSPSGQRLAYAIARGNQENEAGQIIVRREAGGDVASVASMEGGYFHVLYWLDEDRLLAGGWDGGVEKVVMVGLDGSATPIADGSLAGWISMP